MRLGRIPKCSAASSNLVHPTRARTPTETHANTAYEEYAGTVDRCQRSIANADPSGLRVRLPVSASRQSDSAGAMDWRPCTAGTSDPLGLGVQLPASALTHIMVRWQSLAYCACFESRRRELRRFKSGPHRQQTSHHFVVEWQSLAYCACFESRKLTLRRFKSGLHRHLTERVVVIGVFELWLENRAVAL